MFNLNTHQILTVSIRGFGAKKKQNFFLEFRKTNVNAQRTGEKPKIKIEFKLNCETLKSLRFQNLQNQQNQHTQCKQKGK